MKHTTLTLIIVCFLVSCGAKKEVINTTQTEVTPVKISETKPIEVVTETVTDTISNNTVTEVSTPTETQTINTEIFSHKTFNDLLQKHVSTQGNVNYKGFKTDYKSLKKYINNLSKTQPTKLWSHQEKLAYWINAYNALTIDLILRNYPVKSIKDIKNPWDQRLWKLGEKWLNLNDIEHNILRKMDEPRIHFAIVCASFSCPKLQNTAFNASNMDAQLTKATKAFLSDGKRNKITAHKIEISKIFKWFGKDFKTNGSIIDFINRYSSVKVSKNAKTNFKDYNWSLNN